MCGFLANGLFLTLIVDMFRKTKTLLVSIINQLLYFYITKSDHYSHIKTDYYYMCNLNSRTVLSDVH